MAKEIELDNELIRVLLKPLIKREIMRLYYLIEDARINNSNIDVKKVKKVKDNYSILYPLVDQRKIGRIN